MVPTSHALTLIGESYDDTIYIFAFVKENRGNDDDDDDIDSLDKAAQVVHF